MSSKLCFTDINNWYESLNTLRSKDGIELETETAPSLNQAQVRATDVNSYINKLNALRDNEYFRYADWITIGTVARADQIREILKTNINDEITNLDKVCANNSVTTSNSTLNCITKCSDSYCLTVQDITTSNGVNNSNHVTCVITEGTITQFVFTDRGDRTGRCGITFGAFVCGTNITTTDQTTQNKTYANTTNNTNNTRTVVTTYDFSVVSDKPIITNSKTTSRVEN